MRINPIRPISQNYCCETRTQKIHKAKHVLAECKPEDNTSFKGSKGTLLGTGAGLIAGLTAIGIAILSGGTAIPALIAGYAVAGTGITGGIVGNRIEEAIEEKKKEKDGQNYDDDFYG